MKTPTDTVQDLVCGMRFTIEQAAESIEYHGRTFYFCCAACCDAFRLDPKRFLPRDKESIGDHPAA